MSALWPSQVEAISCSKMALTIFLPIGLPCASVILNVFVSEEIKLIWAVTSEMGFVSPPRNIVYSRVTSWGRRRAGFCSSVRSKESRSKLKFGGVGFASWACKEVGKTHAFATRERRQYKRLRTLARNPSLRMLAKDHCQTSPDFGPFIDADLRVLAARLREAVTTSRLFDDLFYLPDLLLDLSSYLF